MALTVNLLSIHRQHPILVTPALDPLLHRLIQLITKHFVLSWYQSISTSKDYLKQPFVQHVQSTIVQLFLKLQVALKSIDYLELLLIDLPELLNLHLSSISNTLQRLHQLDSSLDPTTTHSIDSSTFDQLFVQLHPHPALQLTTTVLSTASPHLIQARSTPTRHSVVPPIPRFPNATTLVSPTYLRLFIESLLQALLTKEEWQAETERFILREIILNAILAPVLCQFTSPRFIHTQLLGYLIQTGLANQPPSNPPQDPSPPTKNDANFDLHSIWDQLSVTFNNLVHFLLLLPGILGSFIQLITAPTPIPIPDRINPRQFEPILKLTSTLLGTSTHLNQLFWLLNLAARFSNRLLTKIVAHLIYKHLLSTDSISNFLIKINSILTDLDHQKTHNMEENGSGNLKDPLNKHPPDLILDLEELDSKEIKIKLEDSLCLLIPNNLFKFIKPINIHQEKVFNQKDTTITEELDEFHYEALLTEEKKRFVKNLLNASINFHSSNVALTIDLLDLFFIKLFPELICNNKN